MDILITNDVCNTLVEPDTLQLEVARAGSMTDSLEDSVLLCGGRDTDGNIRDDCLSYNISSNTWAEHSLLLSPREEASCTVVGGKMFILGGIVEGELTSSVEVWDDQVQQWADGPDMPETRARFCAVPIDSRSDRSQPRTNQCLIIFNPQISRHHRGRNGRRGSEQHEDPGPGD